MLHGQNSGPDGKIDISFLIHRDPPPEPAQSSSIKALHSCHITALLYSCQCAGRHQYILTCITLSIATFVKLQAANLP